MAGVLVSIKELVVRAHFDDDVPAVHELVTVQNGNDTQLLVDHLEPGGIAYCLNVRGDLRLYKGIEIALGPSAIGRVLNALGDPLDDLGPIPADQVQFKDILKVPGRSSNI